LLGCQIKPVLCVGENLAQRKKGQIHQVLKRQITSALKKVKKISDILIAYEPVWAISTFQKGKIKQAATIIDIIEAHTFIREILVKMNKNQAKSVKILYGGTVNPQNSRQILSLKQVNGALVGGASLKFSSFNAIIKSS
jgi:triosephosphate isomerase